MWRIALLLLVLVLPARAQWGPGNCPGGTVYQDGTFVGCLDASNWPASAFTLTPFSTGLNIALAGTITQMGSCIGDEGVCSNTWCSTLDMQCATTWKPPQSAAPVPTTAGQCAWDTTNFKWVCGDGTRTRQYSWMLPDWSVGGAQTSTGFVFDGSCSSGDSGGDCCRNGTISGSGSTKTCTWDVPNSMLTRGQQDAASTLIAYVLTYKSFALSGTGTLTITTPSNMGAPVVIRSLGAATITGGTINLRGKGSQGGTGGTCTASTGGKNGGANGWIVGGTGGAGTGTGGTASTAGISANAAPNYYWMPYTLLGASGGVGATSSATVNYSVVGTSLGATGGGGGACGSSSCAGGTIGASGHGGGSLRIESYTSISCSGSGTEIDVRGTDGGNGSGAGGGGGVEFVAPSISNSCTTDTSAACSGSKPHICTAGGVASASKPANCTVGSNGGTGVVITRTLPQ